MDGLRLRCHCLTATGIGLTALGGMLPLWWLLGRLGDEAGSQTAGVLTLLSTVLCVAASAGAILADDARPASRPRPAGQAAPDESRA